MVGGDYLRDVKNEEVEYLLEQLLVEITAK